MHYMSHELIFAFKPNDGILVEVLHGNIVELEVDAIVNAANSRLLHGGGVAGAIARAGGPSIQSESNRIAPIPTGNAGITSAGSLPCRFVIHAVGPIWGGGGFNEAELLGLAVLRSLHLAAEKKLRSVAFPVISAGVFGFPPQQAASILVTTVRDFIARFPESSLERFILIDIGRPLAAVLAEEVQRWKTQVQTTG